MSTPGWTNLLPDEHALRAMSADKLKATGEASSNCITALARGVSSIGYLLACTASNGETGLSEEAATDIGWLLESLGTLIDNIVATGADASFKLAQVKPTE